MTEAVREMELKQVQVRARLAEAEKVAERQGRLLREKMSRIAAVRQFTDAILEPLGSFLDSHDAIEAAPSPVRAAISRMASLKGPAGLFGRSASFRHQGGAGKPPPGRSATMRMSKQPWGEGGGRISRTGSGLMLQDGANLPRATSSRKSLAVSAASNARAGSRPASGRNSSIRS